MEDRASVKRPRSRGLNGLFWGYLASALASLCLLFICGLFGFRILLNARFILPANTAASQLEATAAALQAQPDFDSAAIPYYYRWALLDESGAITAHNMTGSQLQKARRTLAGDSAQQGLVYPVYHRLVPLAGGEMCLLQYDYAVPYADPALNARLPDFQLCYLGVFGLLALGACLLLTRRHTRILRRDAAAITLACDAVRRRRLDEPLPQAASVRELQAALAAIDTLRRELAASLKEQWAAEQQKNEGLAALTHDLKTPLAVIGGNAELLCEDALLPQQAQSAQAILRSAQRAQGYLARLRQVALGGGNGEKTPEPLAKLAADCAGRGRDICAAAGLQFAAETWPDPLPEKMLPLCREDLLRAVENLFSNAARYSPAGGTVYFSARAEAGRLVLAVEDEGPGFSAEALAKAGRSFYTEDASRPQDGHMGLGLTTAAQTAKRHGGGLVLENTGRGARASVWLPLA